MKLYYENSNVSLYQGDMLEVLDTFEENSIDCIVTDPPYELNFMNKGWDNTGIVFNVDAWKKCLRVLKPGGYLLCFGASRLFYRVFCAIEDAGFEIRDTIMWLYGSGFPKGINIANAIEGKLTVGSANKKDQKLLDGEKGTTSIGYNKENEFQGNRPSNYNGQETTIRPNITTEEAKKWIGWNTALKPAYEPIMVARKPFEGSLVDNVMKNGTGAMNIDECRVPFDSKEPDKRVGTDVTMSTEKMWFENSGGYAGDDIKTYKDNGRFPANVILTYDEESKEEVCGGFPNTKSVIRKPTGGKILNPENGWNNNSMTDTTTRGFEDEGSAARYFKNCEYTDDDIKDIDVVSNLQPNYEPILMARKPFETTLVDNVLENGVGAINIDECRIDFVNAEDYKITANKNQHEKFGTPPMTNNTVYGDYSMLQPKNYEATGRFPANVILTYDKTDKEEVCGGFPYSKGASSQNNYSNKSIYRGQSLNESSTKLEGYREWYNDDGSASRYFKNCEYDDNDLEDVRRYYYCPKASKKDRNEGILGERNTHPTVKPSTLLRYLIRLVAPKNAIILDPFNGSGSTGKACMLENRERDVDYKYIGIDLSEEYLNISRARIEYVSEQKIECNHVDVAPGESMTHGKNRLW